MADRRESRRSAESHRESNLFSVVLRVSLWLSVKFKLNPMRLLLSSEQNAEVCDARNDDSSTTARLKMHLTKDRHCDCEHSEAGSKKKDT